MPPPRLGLRPRMARSCGLQTDFPWNQLLSDHNHLLPDRPAGVSSGYRLVHRPGMSASSAAGPREDGEGHPADPFNTRLLLAICEGKKPPRQILALSSAAGDKKRCFLFCQG